MKKIKELSSLLVLLLVVFSFCFLSYTSFSYDFQFTTAKDENGQDITYTESKDIEKIIKNKPKQFPNKKMADDFFKLKKINSDCIGWILIPKVCYYPIMFNNNNKYYLNHSIYKKYYPAGAIFMNKFSKGRFDNISLIHGHRMLDGTMFGSNDAYENPKFFNENKPIELFDGKKIMYFKVYTVFLYKDGVQFVNQEKQPKGKKRLDYFKKLASLSKCKLDSNVNVNYDSDMLFLQTCDYDFKDARLIIGAYKLGEIELNQKDSYTKIIKKENEINNIFENQYLK